MKLPSRSDMWLVFTTAVVITHAYTLLHLMNDIPSFLNKMSMWRLVGVASYHSIMLLDAAIVSGFFILIATLLPSRFFQRSFGVQGSIMVSLVSFFVVSINKNFGIFNFGSVERFVIWAIIMIPILIALTWGLVHPKVGVHKLLRTIFERIQLLGWLYICISGMGLAIVLVRNVWGIFV